MLSDEGKEVWCVWVTGSGETAISHTSQNSGSWSWVTLESPPSLERTLDPMLDPRQAYMDAIFQPGLFSVTDISKALSVSIILRGFVTLEIVIISYERALAY